MSNEPSYTGRLAVAAAATPYCSAGAFFMALFSHRSDASKNSLQNLLSRPSVAGITPN